MKPTQNLPENFSLRWKLDLKHNTRLNIILQVIGLGWMILSGWGFTLCLQFLRPDFNAQIKYDFGDHPLKGLLILAIIMIVAIVLHEMIHGLFFWYFSRHKPEFGWGPGYAFAAMPDWYFPKASYLWIGLSPLVVLSGFGLALSVIAPQSWLTAILLGMVVNSGGAIGDLYICGRIALDATDVWIKDTGDGFELYGRENFS